MPLNMRSTTRNTTTSTLQRFVLFKKNFALAFQKVHFNSKRNEPHKD